MIDTAPQEAEFEMLKDVGVFGLDCPHCTEANVVQRFPLRGRYLLNPYKCTSCRLVLIEQ